MHRFCHLLTLFMMMTMLFACAQAETTTRALLVACSDFMTQDDLGAATSGNLHMVGSSSDVRGMGGGRAVCTAVVEYFKKHEIKLAYLNTDDFRKPAIKIYLGLGYRPYLYEDDMAERWHALMDYYGIDELEAYDKDLNDLTMFSTKFEGR